MLEWFGQDTHDELSASILYVPSGQFTHKSVVAPAPGDRPDPQNDLGSSTVGTGYPFDWSTAERSAAKPPEVKADLVRDLKFGVCSLGFGVGIWDLGCGVWGLGCQAFGIEGVGLGAFGAEGLGCGV